MRIGFYLVAGVLFGLPILTVGIAAESRAHHHHPAHSAHFAPANASKPGSNQNAVHGAQKNVEHNAPEATTDKAYGDKKSSEHSVGAGPGGNDGTPGAANGGSETKGNNWPDMKALGPVDTRVTTVRPSLQGAKAGMMRPGVGKINAKNGKYFRTRQTFTRHNNNPVVRNTIGVSAAPREVSAGQRAMRADAPSDDRPNVREGAVKVVPGAGPSGVFHPNRDTGPPFANRAAISGNSFPHRGFGPATLGGQIKMTGGLNGSMMRPEY